ncbi:MAG: type II toxin-antitoxin system RelE/ParE family toxin [Bacteroidetes bacterium]|jgi:plasmid stabilization system protein ParE|nr:type II toxin-antitoxin system RelE/ParE family toxin [Bacteroidota bacterium]
MYSLIILEEAKQEWFDATLYYESKQKGLGERFTLAVEEHFDIITETPKHFNKIKKEYRQVLVKRFPFLIIYRIDELQQAVVITSVFHSKRNPKNKFNRK